MTNHKSRYAVCAHKKKMGNLSMAYNLVRLVSLSASNPLIGRRITDSPHLSWWSKLYQALLVQWWVTSKKLYIGRGSITVLTRKATWGLNQFDNGTTSNDEFVWQGEASRTLIVCKSRSFVHVSKLNWNFKIEVWTNDRLQNSKIWNEMEKEMFFKIWK